MRLNRGTSVGSTASTITTRDRIRFDPRPCARGDAFAGSWAIISMFRSTPLREGRPRSRTRRTPATLFRSTPLREGRLVDRRLQVLDGAVSIHAPAPRGDHAVLPQKIFVPLAIGQVQTIIAKMARGKLPPTPPRRGRNQLSAAKPTARSRVTNGAQLFLDGE